MSDKAPPVGGAGPISLQSGDVRGSAVALMLRKTVVGVQGVQLLHLPVPRHLGHDAGGGDGIGQRVPMNDTPFLSL